MGVGVLEAVEEEEGGAREEDSRRKGGGGRGRSRLMVAWKRRLREQNQLLQQVQKERDDHLRAIQSQLMVLESQLRRRQREVEAVLEEKEATIRHQRQIILSLTRALHDATTKKKRKKKKEGDGGEEEPQQVAREVVGVSGCGVSASDGAENCNIINTSNNNNNGDEGNNNVPVVDGEETSLIITTPSSKSDPESMNDSDSAIMLEDSNFDSLVIVPLGKGEVKVVRSVSDVVEVASTRSCLGNGTAIATGVPNSSSSSFSSSSSSSSSISSSSSSSVLGLSSEATQLLNPAMGGTGPGSLSTSSCSSEESDDSPTCTLTKHCNGMLRTVYSLKETELEEENEEEVETRRTGQCDVDDDDDVVSIIPSQSSSSCSPSIAPSLHSILKATSSYDSDATLSDGESDEDEDVDDDDDEEGSIISQATTASTTLSDHLHTIPSYHSRHHQSSAERRQHILGSYEKLHALGSNNKKPPTRPEEEIQVTYNRVMSNHRSVTKPKDVKYRRINKAKSRSLEELRGKLKYWNERAGKHSLSVDLDTHSYA